MTGALFAELARIRHTHLPSLYSTLITQGTYRMTRSPLRRLIFGALRRLLSLAMPTDEAGHLRSWFVPFDDAARDQLGRAISWFRLGLR